MSEQYWSARFVPTYVPTTSPNRAVFELNWCRFRAQIVPVSSPRRHSFEPKSCRFRAQTVNLSSPVRAVIEPCSSCYRTLFVLLSSTFVLCPFEHWLLNMLRGKTWRFFQQVSFSKLNRFDSWKLTHLGRFV